MYEPVNIAKTHEILARFRPIAPKPNLPHPQFPAPTPQLRTRVRKRTRTVPPKRQKAPAPPLVERDLLQNLQSPKIISPRPVRPVGSTISIVLIRTGSAGSPTPATPRRLEEVEDDVESDPMPGIVSDCNNRVRMANSAYKELVGQPECMWLDAMVCRRGMELRPHSRRINGEVALEFCGEAARGLESKEGFCCRVKIEWECDGRKSFVDAACEVVRVYCEPRDYLFAWRFYVAEARRTALLSAA